MKKVILGMAFVAMMSFGITINAQDSKTKKEAPKTETKKNEASCCSASANASAKSCCSQQTTATAAGTKSCCSQKTAVTAKQDEKSSCCQVEKVIADKKTEAKQKK